MKTPVLSFGDWATPPEVIERFRWPEPEPTSTVAPCHRCDWVSPLWGFFGNKPCLCIPCLRDLGLRTLTL
jgi:hypothetical protein